MHLFGLVREVEVDGERPHQPNGLHHLDVSECSPPTPPCWATSRRKRCGTTPAPLRPCRGADWPCWRTSASAELGAEPAGCRSGARRRSRRTRPVSERSRATTVAVWTVDPLSELGCGRRAVSWSARMSWARERRPARLDRRGDDVPGRWDESCPLPTSPGRWASPRLRRGAGARPRARAASNTLLISIRRRSGRAFETRATESCLRRQRRSQGDRVGVPDDRLHVLGARCTSLDCRSPMRPPSGCRPCRSETRGSWSSDDVTEPCSRNRRG